MRSNEWDMISFALSSGRGYRHQGTGCNHSAEASKKYTTIVVFLCCIPMLLKDG